MQRAVVDVLRSLGFAPELVFLSTRRSERWNLFPRRMEADGMPGFFVGYVPSIDYLNYLVPSVTLRSILSPHEVFVVVSGTSAAALPLVLAKKPFVSWIATTSRAEFAAAQKGSETTRPALSVRVNSGLLPLNEMLERFILRRTPKLFALSRRTAVEFATLGVPGAEVLYPPVDLALFRPERGAPFPRPYVLGAGRLDDPRKDFPFLVRAVEQARSRLPGLTLVLAGAVVERSEVARFGRARLGDQFITPGNLSGAALAAAYSGASAFALSSVQEGLGIVVAEAMACGTPTVQRRCGGADELVDDGKTGFLLEADDLLGFASRLVDLASDTGKRNELGREARRRAEGLFSPQAFRRAFVEGHRQIFPVTTASEVGARPMHDLGSEN
jgi:D-inositol-3-phosphate glycosyltransferase